MRLVLDTNVMIAALIARGICADLLEHCVLSHTIVASRFIFNELRNNLHRKFNFTDPDINIAIVLLTPQVEIVTPMALDRHVYRDSD